MQKQGTSDSELLNQAIAIAAEQRLGLSDAHDVAYSSQVSSPTVSPFHQRRVSMFSCSAPSYDPQMFMQHQPPTQYAHLQGLPLLFPV